MIFLVQKHIKKAFSLLELVVVIVVIAILAALAYPSLTTVIDKTYDQKALAQLEAFQRDAYYKAYALTNQSFQESDFYTGNQTAPATNAIITSSANDPSGPNNLYLIQPSTSSSPVGVNGYLQVSVGISADPTTGVQTVSLATFSQINHCVYEVAQFGNIVNTWIDTAPKYTDASGVVHNPTGQLCDALNTSTQSTVGANTVQAYGIGENGSGYVYLTTPIGVTSISLACPQTVNGVIDTVGAISYYTTYGTNTYGFNNSPSPTSASVIATENGVTAQPGGVNLSSATSFTSSQLASSVSAPSASSAGTYTPSSPIAAGTLIAIGVGALENDVQASCTIILSSGTSIYTATATLTPQNAPQPPSGSTAPTTTEVFSTSTTLAEPPSSPVPTVVATASPTPTNYANGILTGLSIYSLYGPWIRA